jgi:hypothetical protein
LLALQEASVGVITEGLAKAHGNPPAHTSE